jgi:hypothetical protein
MPGTSAAVRASQGDHGNVIHHGGCQAGHQVCGAGARSPQAYARLTGHPSITIRGKSGGLLVPDQQVANPRAVKCVVEGQDRPSGEAEEDFHVLAAETFEKDFGASELLSHSFISL